MLLEVQGAQEVGPLELAQQATVLVALAVGQPQEPQELLEPQGRMPALRGLQGPQEALQRLEGQTVAQPLAQQLEPPVGLPEALLVGESFDHQPTTLQCQHL